MFVARVRRDASGLLLELPTSFIEKAGLKEGDDLSLVETAGGGWSLVAADSLAEVKDTKAEDIMTRYHETLRILAQ